MLDTCYQNEGLLYQPIFNSWVVILGQCLTTLSGGPDFHPEPCLTRLTGLCSGAGRTGNLLLPVLRAADRIRTGDLLLGRETFYP